MPVLLAPILSEMLETGLLVIFFIGHERSHAPSFLLVLMAADGLGSRLGLVVDLLEVRLEKSDELM